MRKYFTVAFRINRYYTSLGLLFLFISCCSAGRALAKNNIHVFKATTAAYAPLTGATPVTSAVMSYDSFAVSLLAGQTFNLFGKPRLLTGSSVLIMRNGRIQFSEDTAFSVIDVLNTGQLELIDGSSSVSYTLEGAGTDKILKVEWKNLRVKSGLPGNFINVQTWIYQATGIIEFRYGPRSANNASGYTDPVTGLYIGISYVDYGFSKMYEKMQVIGTLPNYTIDSVLNLNVPNIEGVPEEGTVFRFVPKAVASTITAMNATDDIAVYPNPAGNVVKVNLEGEPAYIITDFTGKSVQSGRCSRAKAIDVSKLPNGMYTLSIATTEALPYSKQICITH